MNIKYRRVPAEFGPETRFEVTPLPPAPFRVLQESEFERLKLNLLSALLQNTWKPELSARLRRAANEAAALAWVTPFPLLLFPVLFEEKAQAALATTEPRRAVSQPGCALQAV